MCDKTKDLGRTTFGIAIMFGIYWMYSYFLEEYIPIADSLKSLLGLVVLYVIGLGMFVLITKKVSVQKYEKKKISLRTIGLSFLLQFTAIMVLSVMVNISTVLGADNTSADINATSLYMLFMLLIFNPIIEEIVFRKILADKLLKYGEGFYMLVSSFCFGIVHGVSLGVPHIIYTFILGMIWSYLMVKTGNIKLVIFMHALSNFFGSVIIQSLLNISMIVTGIYSMLLMLSGVIGLIMFIVNKKKVVIDGESFFIKKGTMKEIFSNKGIWFYMALTLIVMIIK
ncbi:MAG: CPBP family intramembrane metalloprotease [Lachnospiraceae bacterium]|nr:CPBP family intramembrane metalloprotease [Lachnospiraceae bacterium]